MELQKKKKKRERERKKTNTANTTSRVNSTNRKSRTNWANWTNWTNRANRTKQNKTKERKRKGRRKETHQRPSSSGSGLGCGLRPDRGDRPMATGRALRVAVPRRRRGKHRSCLRSGRSWSEDCDCGGDGSIPSKAHTGKRRAREGRGERQGREDRPGSSGRRSGGRGRGRGAGVALYSSGEKAAGRLKHVVGGRWMGG